MYKRNKLRKLTRAVSQSLSLCSLVILGQLLFAVNSPAESQCLQSDFVWPRIFLPVFGLDNYIGGTEIGGDPGIGYSGSIETVCESLCCKTFSDDLNKREIYIDGHLASYGETISEGPAHTLLVKGELANISWVDRLPYSVSASVSVDKTPPIISLTKPEANVIISTADLTVSGNVTDAGIGIGVVKVRVSADCGLKNDLFDHGGSYHKWGTGTYCSKDHYPPDRDPQDPDCDAKISGGFNIAYDLRDYLDLASGQDCNVNLTVSAVDRISNGDYSPYLPYNEKTLQFTIDQAPPTVKILTPVADTLGMSWGDPNNPVISGTAEDLSKVKRVWLTIKDENTGRWWDGSAWMAGTSRKWFNGTAWIAQPFTAGEAKITGENNVTWTYAGLSREVMKSGIFTITAYAEDKYGHVGQGIASGNHTRTKKDYLGKADFTEFSMHMKEVVNIGPGRSDENPYTFISNYNEGLISVASEITPERIAGTLNNYVQWNVYGKNSDSGRPNPPHGGNPSTFLVEIPPIPARPLGRPDPMGYTVFPRVEYTFYNGEHIIYECADHGEIHQDNLDTLRQEYLDLQTGYDLDRTKFDQERPAFPGLLVDGGFETVKHAWHILKYLNTKAIVLNKALVGDYGISLHPSSGYRCPIGNKNLKPFPGEYNSNHMLGKALDYSQHGLNYSKDNWDVWMESKSNGATEYLLYDQDDCRVDSATNTRTEYSLPLTLKVKCPNKKESDKIVTQYTHGHVAWP